MRIVNLSVAAALAVVVGADCSSLAYYITPTVFQEFSFSFIILSGQSSTAVATADALRR